MSTTQEIIEKLDLKPHPEGGFFRETYRSKGEIAAAGLNSNYYSSRNYSTCIYFLLTSEKFSAFHRIKQDEIWHFYDGATIELHIISESGVLDSIKIGRDIFNGQTPQVIVPGGSWFAAEVSSKDSHSLVGCTVAPGFDFSDFELADRTRLISEFPQHEDLIRKFTR
ncbi:cupin domain-containing protein [Gramella sp. BOM4]|nr:cupin domain-containing protein [Christiangramia bathymodioli]